MHSIQSAWGPSIRAIPYEGQPIYRLIGAFRLTCPTRYISPEEHAAHTSQTIEYLKLMHPYYRKLCRILVDVDEWGQVELMRFLTKYARMMLTKPPSGGSQGSPGNEKSGSSDLDKDLQLLLTSVEPTFMSRNPAVVMAATKVYYYLAPRGESWKKFVKPLLRLLAVSKEVERVIVRYLVVLTSRQRYISVSSLAGQLSASFSLCIDTSRTQLQRILGSTCQRPCAPSKGQDSAFVESPQCR